MIEQSIRNWESQLVSRAVAGDARAFEALAEIYRPSLKSLALGKLRNLEDANDVVQDTLIKAFRAIADFDPTRPIRPWLCRICVNCCVDSVRGKKRDAEPLELHENLLVDELCHADTNAEMSYDQDQIMGAIERLPVHYRQIILMRHFNQLDVNEIAVALGKPEGTIKSWLFRARSLLRKDLERVSFGYAA